jgi:hypothetical protein
MINLPEGLERLVNLVLHPCLGLLLYQVIPQGQDHPSLLASLILYGQLVHPSFLWGRHDQEAQINPDKETQGNNQEMQTQRILALSKGMT